jgi:RND family efflux transporter MFP subunit
MRHKSTSLPAIKTASALLLLLPISPVLAQNGEEAIPVTVAKVLATSVAPLVPAAGTVFSRHETQITAGIAGRLQWLAEPGDLIKQNQPVARFDCEMLELQRERQLAEAERAEINLKTLTRESERLESLRESSVISEMQLERTQADRDLAASDLRIARITIKETDSQLNRCSVKAPFSGVVTERLRYAGEDVERSTVLAAMTDTQNLEVRASVPIRYLPRMQVGKIAEVKMSELRLEGRIRKIVPAANSQSQTFEVRLDLPEDAPQVVAAGQLVSVTLPLSASAALTVPRDSVVLREDGAFVMRINSDEKAERVAVEVTEANGDHLAIRGDLESGDRIAVRGSESLEDGELVSVQSET